MGDTGVLCFVRVGLREPDRAEDCQRVADTGGAGAPVPGNTVEYRFDANRPRLLAWRPRLTTRPHLPLLGGTE